MKRFLFFSTASLFFLTIHSSASGTLGVSSESATGYSQLGIQGSYTSENDEYGFHWSSWNVDLSKSQSETVDSSGTQVNKTTSFSTGLGFEMNDVLLDLSWQRSQTPETNYSSQGPTLDISSVYKFSPTTVKSKDPQEEPVTKYQKLTYGLGISSYRIRQEFSVTLGSGGRLRRTLTQNYVYEINQTEWNFHLVYKPTDHWKIKASSILNTFDPSADQLKQTLTRANLLQSPPANLVDSIDGLSSSSWKVGLAYAWSEMWEASWSRTNYKNLIDDSQSFSNSYQITYHGETWEPALGLRKSSSDNLNYWTFDLTMNF